MFEGQICGNRAGAAWSLRLRFGVNLIQKRSNSRAGSLYELQLLLEISPLQTLRAFPTWHRFITLREETHGPSSQSDSEKSPWPLIMSSLHSNQRVKSMAGTSTQSIDTSREWSTEHRENKNRVGEVWDRSTGLGSVEEQHQPKRPNTKLTTESQTQMASKPAQDPDKRFV